jgi:hypothetical protein
MKLRIKGDSIRLRLSQGEVTKVAAGEAVEERTRFPGGVALVYRLRAAKEATQVGATFAGGVVDVTMPKAMVAEWAGTEQVSLSGDQALGDGGSLRLLVEKDFACLMPREGEDETDNFPHPKTGSATC